MLIWIRVAGGVLAVEVVIRNKENKKQTPVLNFRLHLWRVSPVSLTQCRGSPLTPPATLLAPKNSLWGENGPLKNPSGGNFSTSHSLAVLG
jgi:hypothetical protein